MHTTGPGVHDGVPGRRPARAGPRARGRRVRVGRDAPRAGAGALGKAAGQERADPDGKALPRSCRAASASSSAAARSRRGTAIPGIFASLATGNAVDRQAASGRDPAAGASPCGSRAKCWPRRASTPTSSRCSRTRRGDDVAQKLALRPEVKHHRLHRQHGQRPLAGGATRGRRRSTPRRPASTRSSSTRAADIKGVARNIAFSLALYSGQMCTAPQNIYVPKDGIDTAEGPLSFDQVAAAHRRGRAEAAGRSGARRRGAGRRAERRRDAAARGRALARHRRARHAGDRASGVSRTRRCARR